MNTNTSEQVEPITRAHQRLREELADDGIFLEDDQVIQELEHARRPPIHEGRMPEYGAVVLRKDSSLFTTADLVDLISLDLALDECRTFSDGRSSFLVRQPNGTALLACFRRSVQYEADLTGIQAATGATIIQRTAAGIPRVFTENGVVAWNGRNWNVRPSARSILPSVVAAVPESTKQLLGGILELCVHWLSPAQIGATLLLDVDPVHDDSGNLDLDAARRSPQLSVTAHEHFAALFAALGQTDLAALVDQHGTVTHLGVGLRSSVEAEDAVSQDRGMRHRSAARFTWDHHHTVAFVVSEDGPVTVFRGGAAVAVCSPRE